MTAHEFWVEAEDYSVARSDAIRANLRLGQDFVGSTFSWNDRRFVRFDQAEGADVRPVEGRLGDRPAANVPAANGGILVYRSDYDRVLYDKAEEFFDFARKAGLDGAAERHRERGLPASDFREAYFRNAKALIRVDGAFPRDRAFGLPLEIVIEGTPSAGGEVVARVLFDGAPLANALVRAWRKPEGAAEAAETFDVRTDGEGRAAVPLGGEGAWLLNVVHLREPSPELARKREVVWETLWASTTFSTAP